MASRYKVQPGDCLASIAFRHGFHPDTLWDHPGNAALKAKRESPYLLVAGDEVMIPDPRPRQVPAATGRRHTFRRLGVPELFQLRFLDRSGEPRAGVPYLFRVGGEEREGETDAAGALREAIPPDATEAEVVLLLADVEEHYAVDLGFLDPVTELSGVKARLNSLGYPCGPVGEPLDEEARAELERFQADHDLPATGEPDEATRAKLAERYGS